MADQKRLRSLQPFSLVAPAMKLLLISVARYRTVRIISPTNGEIMPTKQRPTNEQVAAEIAKLKEIQPKVRETSLFGDNNRDAIDAQINVLERRISNDAIYDMYGEDSDDFAQNVLDSAVEARDYLDGHVVDDEIPSVSWATLIQED
jgi:hypothetical protein